MKIVDVPPVPVRPACLSHREHGDVFPTVECVDYYINLLISHAPAELTAEHAHDGKTVIWRIVSLPEKQELHTESMPVIFFRMSLARLAFGYMDQTPYG